MRLLRLVAPIVLLAVASLVTPALAGDVSIDTAIGVQYGYPLFLAYVTAHGTAPLIDAHLLVNGTLVTPSEADAYTTSATSTVWKVYVYSYVLKAGDVLTVVVTDVSGGTGTKALSCVAGTSKKNSSSGSVTCQ